MEQTDRYLKYIEPEKSVIDKGQYELGTLDQLDGWDGVKGLAFENLVVNNSAMLRPLLGIGKATITSVAPYRRVGSRDGTRSGLQVDLLLQQVLPLFSPPDPESGGGRRRCQRSQEEKGIAKGRQAEGEDDEGGGIGGEAR